MPTKTFNKEQLATILTKIKYFDNFKENYLNRNYNHINYGKRIGDLSFDNLFAAAANYTYPNQVEESVFSEWNNILNDENSTEEEMLCAILEIFVWGDVLNGNVKTALKLYKNKNLKSYIRQVRELLNKKEILSKNIENKSSNHEIIWSSGWTKVYSFINNDIIIYDSRVSAFLNHTLTYQSNYIDTELKELKKLTNLLFNFRGAESRERLVDKKQYGFKNSAPNGINGFNANLISSWIVELLNQKLKLDKEIRSFERAFLCLDLT